MKFILRKYTSAHNNQKLILGSSLSIVSAIALATASPVNAQVGIDSLNATYQNGTSTSYSTTVGDPCDANDYPGGCNSNINMQFGDGATNDLVLSGFTVGADNYSLVQLADEVGFRRIDGQGATGERNLVLFEYNTNNQIRTSYTNTLAGAMLGTTINRGVDNGFSNSGDTDVASNNIERIDYIIKAGLSVPGVSANDIGFLVLERGGNDPFQIAAITSLDASGKPNGFGPLRRIAPSTWGRSSFDINTAVMRREENEPNFRPSHLVGSQTISGVYTSIASLGLADGQTFYGYALFPNDIDSSNDLINLTDFPTDTSGASGEGGLDLMAGGGIFLKDGLTTVSGTLYEDSDGDDNLDGNEQKLPANITVRLLNNNNQQIATAMTDSNGAYTFFGVSNGNYRIRVDTTDTDIPNGYTLGTPNNLSVNVAGSPVTNQNFGFDVPVYTVSGTVYEDFGAGGNNNNTFDNGEETIGNVTVNLFADANNDGQADGAAVKTLETNSANGAYQFTDVAPGRYVIQVDTRDTDIPSTYAIGTPNPININVSADVTNQDFGFNTVSKTCPAGSFLPEQTFLNFQNPQLVSGSALGLGAVYRFPNVATDVDALVEIKSFNNATLTQIDVNNFGVQSAFQPEVRANSQNAGDYSVDFDIQFVQSGTSTPVELRKVLATGIDIDGDNVQVREASELGGNQFTSYAIDSDSRLTATQLSPTRVKFESTTTFNLNNITINPLNQGSAFYDNNTQKIEYRAGLIIDPGDANNVANQRLTSLVFDCVEYNQAVVNQEYKISGTVYEDFGASGNNNNTFDNGEGTIGNVTVDLFADSNNDGQPDSNTPVKTIETDAATGAYEFTEVIPGRYLIRVNTRDTDIPDTHAIGTPNPIQVNVSNSDITNQDFGFNTVSKTCPAGSFLPEQTFLDFQNPQLESGTALSVGAVYRFPNVAADIDALVEIKSFNNATLTQIDVNNFGVQSGFQPEVRANSQNAGNYSVDFDIQFVQSGTSTPVEMRKILATGIDIDGDNVQVREASELGGNRFTSYAIDSNSNLTATELSPTRVRFESTTTFNLNNITINPSNQGSAFYDSSVQKIEYRAGLIIDPGNANNVANQRLTSLVFDCVTYDLAVTNNPNVILVKRITAINGNRNQNPNDGTVLNQFVDDTSSPQQGNDNSPNWPDNYLLGAIDAGKVKPEDEIEYTVYFLNIGNGEAADVRVCDRITANQDFQPDAYAAGRGIQLKLGNNAQTNLTNANDNGDRAQLINPGGAVPANCNLQGGNTNGTLQIDITGNTGSPSLTTMPGSTGKGTPNNSYGLFRFTTKVQP